jgi:hypothetical protein
MGRCQHPCTYGTKQCARGTCHEQYQTALLQRKGSLRRLAKTKLRKVRDTSEGNTAKKIGTNPLFLNKTDQAGKREFSRMEN